MKFSAVLFDRDGTVIFDRHYLSDPAGVELIPGTGEALARLGDAGVDCFLVSNQSGIGRGYFPESGWHDCQKRLDELLAQYGAKLKDVRFCPHAPETACSCRKPSIGMWESLRDAYGLEARSCAMVGDKPEDLLFGVNSGFAVAVLVLTGKGRKSAEKLGMAPEAVEALEKSRGFQNVDGKLLTGGVSSSTQIFIAADVDAAVEGLFRLS